MSSNDGYYFYTPPVLGVPRDMDRQDAEQCFSDFMRVREERITVLQCLLGDIVHPDHLFACIDEVEARFRSHLGAGSNPGRLSNLSYSMIFDLGIAMGTWVVDNSSNLEWHFCTELGARSFYYQSPVIYNPRRRPKLTHYDPISSLSMYAHAVLEDPSIPAGELRETLQGVRKFD